MHRLALARDWGGGAALESRSGSLACAVPKREVMELASSDSAPYQFTDSSNTSEGGGGCVGAIRILHSSFFMVCAWAKCPTGPTIVTILGAEREAEKKVLAYV